MIDEQTYYNSFRLMKRLLDSDDKDTCLNIIDSFSSNQIESKNHLINIIKELDILLSDKNVVIWGSWYGSIFIPNIAPYVNEMILIDLDEQMIERARSIFYHYKNINFRLGNIFEERLKKYNRTNLVINTSCEHMPPMNTYKYFNDFEVGTYFAFQSNNMFNIPTHINCVNTLEDFEMQMPINFEIIYSDSIMVPGWEEHNGERFTIIARKVC